MMYKLFVVLARALVSCGDVLLPGLPAMLGSARVAVAREGAQAAVAALVVPAGVALVVPAGAALVVPVGAALVVPAGVALVVPAGAALVVPAGVALLVVAGLLEVAG